MATPTMVTLTGTMQTPPGTPDATFRLVMEQQDYLFHADGTVIEPTRYEAVTDANGALSITVPASTDPAWRTSTSGTWTYRAYFNPVEKPQGAPFRVGVPHDMGTELTFNALIPVGGVVQSALYAPINHTHSGETVVDWVNITGKPSTFAPSTHSHPASQITDFAAALNKQIEIRERRGTAGEFVIPRRNANGFAALDTEILYATHFKATQTRTISSVVTHCGVAATGTSHAWLGFLRWDVGVGYTPVAVSVDDPSRWNSVASPDTPVFGVDGFGSANLGDLGFDMVEDQEYAFTVQWVGSGTKPQLRACAVEDGDAFTEPRQNGYMGLAAPPSALLQPGWLVGSLAQFQGYMKY